MNLYIMLGRFVIRFFLNINFSNNQLIISLQFLRRNLHQKMSCDF